MFSIQLVRVVLWSLRARAPDWDSTSVSEAYFPTVAIHQMLTVSISHFYLYFTDSVLDRV